MLKIYTFYTRKTSNIKTNIHSLFTKLVRPGNQTQNFQAQQSHNFRKFVLKERKARGIPTTAGNAVVPSILYKQPSLSYVSYFIVLKSVHLYQSLLALSVNYVILVISSSLSFSTNLYMFYMQWIDMGRWYNRS